MTCKRHSWERMSQVSSCSSDWIETFYNCKYDLCLLGEAITRHASPEASHAILECVLYFLTNYLCICFYHGALAIYLFTFSYINCFILYTVVAGLINQSSFLKWNYMYIFSNAGFNIFLFKINLPIYRKFVLKTYRQRWCDIIRIAVRT